MEVKEETFSAIDRTAVQVMGAQDERTWPFGKPARPLPARLEDPGVSAFCIVLHWAAARRAGDPVKKAPERAPHRVGGCSGREQHRIDGFKVKPEAEKLQLHVFFKYTHGAAPGRGVARACFGYNVYAFDSYNFSAGLKSGGLRV